VTPHVDINKKDIKFDSMTVDIKVEVNQIEDQSASYDDLDDTSDAGTEIKKFSGRPICLFTL